MKVPRWYVWELAIWLVTGLPFQWFFTAFNGLSFFSLLDAPGPNGPSVPLWLFAVAFLYHPVLLAPAAIWSALSPHKPLDRVRRRPEGD
ncbi:hypothetical protein [Sphingomonas aerophila]|uniref:Uncharacterized protein n=1 Tax=Sphingomonas aerophila TaxID=1344948 RepID=A0A7W9BBW5_9SPHN|nr:hypothetical protein [Sphingomonas aerophila]MBB5714164.1 hypothetical protein [Sphingomonas aerophila]